VSQTPRDDRAATGPGDDAWTAAFWLSNAADFEQLWSLLSAPRLQGFDPAAITAVLVAKDSPCMPSCRRRTSTNGMRLTWRPTRCGSGDAGELDESSPAPGEPSCAESVLAGGGPET
jgi:hypothetical protein